MSRLLGVALAALACACGTVSEGPSDAPVVPDAPPPPDGAPDAAPPVDECTAGTHDCDANATCTDQAVGFTCACNAGYDGDGKTCTDIDECTAGTHTCDPTGRCDNTAGAFTCTCPGGASDVNGDGSVCSRSGDGHVVIVGHDFFERNADIDRLVGNAALLANTAGTIDILGYTEHANIDGAGVEVDGVDAAITERATALGRTVSITHLGDHTQLADQLFGKDVLLVYEQMEFGDDGTLGALADEWRDIVQAFLLRGGIVVFTTGGFDYILITRMGLADIPSAPTLDFGGAAIGISSSADPVAADMPGGYTASNATTLYTTNEPGVVTRADAGPAVVIHRVVAGGHAVLMGHDFFERTADIDTLLANAVAMAHTSGTIQVLGYTQYSDNTVGGEPDNTRASINERLTAMGRTVTITDFADSAQLGANLPGKHVLVVYEQEATTGATLAGVGTAWAPRLARFVRAGGVVIVLDHNFGSGGTWNVIASGGLIGATGIAGNLFSETLTVVAPTHPLAAGLGATYVSSNGSVAFTGTSDASVISTAGTGPVVVEKPFAPF